MAKAITELTVSETEELNPGMTRIHFRGDLAAFADSADTDRYVKLIFGDPAELDRGARPVMRTYTVTQLDVEAGTMAIDFVVHGDDGVAGPWARTVRPGETISVRGPGGAYAPDRDADWHLFVGDEAAIPAIRQGLAALAPTACGAVLVQVDGPAYEQVLRGPEGVEFTWLHRSDPAHPGLGEAVKALSWRDGRVHAFVHGEGQSVMKEIRPYLLGERGVPRADLSISGYWRRGRTEEAIREWKSELARAEKGAS